MIPKVLSRPQVVITNTGSTRIECPFMVVKSISVSGVTLKGATGMTAEGDPYVNLFAQTSDGLLAAGEATKPLTLIFNNPSRQRFTFDGLCMGRVIGVLQSIRVAPDPFTLIAGERGQLVVTGRYGDLADRNITPSNAGTTYCSSEPVVVLVSPEGMLLALRAGKAVVHVTTRSGAGVLMASTTVNVPEPPRPIVVSPGRIFGEVLDASNEQPIAGASVSAPGIPTTAQTDATGHFILPVIADGHYLVKIEKTGYTFVQRHVDVPLGQDTVVERSYLTPLDTKTTSIIAAAGGTASDSTGTVEVTIPAGALPNNANIRITPVKELDHLVGIQPAYGLFAFGAQLEPSPMTFATPVTLRVKHGLGGVRAGDRFPLTRWDDTLGRWTDIGELVVSADTEWLEGTLTTFSYVHCNCSHPPPWITPYQKATPQFRKNRTGNSCPVGVPAGSFVEADTGYLREDHQLPALQSLGRDQSLSLVYNSGTVSPQVRLALSNPSSNIYVAPDRAEWELTVAGAARRISYRGYAHASEQAYSWDGRNDAGGVVATGTYACQLVLTDRFNGGTYQWVCGPLNIGGGGHGGNASPMPIQTQREVSFPRTFNSRVTIENLNNSEFGAGWKLGGIPQLHFSPDGVVLLTGPGGPCCFLPDASGVYVNEPGETSILQALPDGTFQRTLKDKTVFTFTANGRCSRKIDRNGNATSYTYDPPGLLKQVTDPAGRASTLVYDQIGRVTSITDPGGRVTHFQVDVGNNLTQIMNPDGSTIQFQYDAAHRLTSKTDQRGQVYQYVYDNLGRINKTIAPDGAEYNFIPRDRLALVNPVLAAGGGTRENPAIAIDSELVDSNNQDELCGYVDRRGTTTLYRVDERGGMIEVSKSSGGTLLTRTTIQRDTDGYPVKVVRPNGAAVSVTYDSQKNVSSVKEDFIDATSTYTYDPVSNQPTSITDAQGHRTTFDLDERGNVVKATDPLGNQTQLSYDARGLLASVTDAESSATTFHRDAFGNLEALLDPLGHETRIEYDAAGNVLTTTDANGRLSRYTYDAMNRLLSQRSCCGGAAEFTYDPAGDLLTVTDGNTHTTQFTYDINRRLSSLTDPLGAAESYEYNSADDLNAKLTRAGETAAYDYDALGRLIGKAIPGDFVGFTHDVVGNLLLTWAKQHTLSRSFDLVSRLIASNAAFEGVDIDSDHDCLPDSVELRLGLDAYDPDSDHNDVLDGNEDSDYDRVTNCEEVLLGTDPGKPDTDGDGCSDGEELNVGTDPLDPSSFPSRAMARPFTIFNVFDAPNPLPMQRDFTVVNQAGFPRPVPVLRDFTIRNSAQ